MPIGGRPPPQGRRAPAHGVCIPPRLQTAAALRSGAVVLDCTQQLLDIPCAAPCPPQRQRPLHAARVCKVASHARILIWQVCGLLPRALQARRHARRPRWRRLAARVARGDLRAADGAAEASGGDHTSYHRTPSHSTASHRPHSTASHRTETTRSALVQASTINEFRDNIAFLPPVLAAHLREAEARAQTIVCHRMPLHTIAYHRIPYHTIPSHPIPSHPIPSHRIASLCCAVLRGARAALRGARRARGPRERPPPLRRGRQRRARHRRRGAGPPVRSLPRVTRGPARSRGRAARRGTQSPLPLPHNELHNVLRLMTHGTVCACTQSIIRGTMSGTESRPTRVMPYTQQWS